jgi:SAM-dependent methyltransferase
MNDWIEKWFGSEYYEQLYKHRNKNEAQYFLNNLISFLKINPPAKVLDCGCGKGRYSFELAARGFEVTGIDVCESNILELRKHETSRLEFYRHDIRNFFRVNYYDAVFSFFTSFGYYASDTENRKMIRSMATALKKGGTLVIDFMNTTREVKNLVPQSEFNCGEIFFIVKRKFSDGKLEKSIEVHHQGKIHCFYEMVKAHSKSEIENFITSANLNIIHLLGDYHLGNFDETSSDRMIFIAKKI